MGRPSRKRPRPPPPSKAGTSEFGARNSRQLLPSAVSRFEECGSIQSLVIKGPPPMGSCSHGVEIATTTASVQQVWGALDQEDVTATTVALELSLGASIDVDDAGVAWLLHTSRQWSTRRDRKTGLSECSPLGDSSLGPQQQRQAASDASTTTASADSSQATPLGPPFPDNSSRSVTDCTSSWRQEHGEEEARRPFCVCDAAVHAELSKVKSEFDDIPPAVFKRARSACNPAEALGNGLFLNRSAMKLANIDAIAGLSACCSRPFPVGNIAYQQGMDGVEGETRYVGGNKGRMNEKSHASAPAAAGIGNRDGKWRQQQRQQQGKEETEQQQQQQQQQQEGKEQQPEQQQQQQQQQLQGQEQETPRGKEQPGRDSALPPFLFADLCGGPGGFSEYLLLRRRQLGLPARGWGISLRGCGAKPNPGWQTTEDDRGDRRSTCRDEIATSHDFHAEHGGAGSEGEGGIVRHGYGGEDPCAWRLDHLSSWCDVSTERNEPGGATLYGGGLVCRSAVTGYVEGTSERRASNGSSHPKPLESLAVREDPDPNACPLARDASVCGGEGGCRGGRLGERDGGENRGLDEVAADNDGFVCESNMRPPHLKTPVATAPLATDAAATTTTTTTTTTPPPPPTSVATTPATTAATVVTTTCMTVPPVLEMRISYGPAGTGDLADEENMYGFVESVLASTEGRRLDLVVADGGIQAARDSLEQECLMTPLVYSEALTALLLLKEGGSFVCKLFEVWTEPTASLVYSLHRRFRRIAIVKPITSRPASGERYLVCVGLLPPPSPTGCRFTDNLRAKVHVLQRRSGFDSPAAGSGAKKDFPTFRAGGSGSGSGSGGVASEAAAARAGVLDVALEMNADAGFLSFLRLSNERLASLQTKACARIVQVASSKRGRAWAFRDSKGRGGDRGGDGAPGVGDGEGERGEEGFGEGTGMSDEGALRCFREAWRLDQLEGYYPR